MASLQRTTPFMHVMTGHPTHAWLVSWSYGCHLRRNKKTPKDRNRTSECQLFAEKGGTFRGHVCAFPDILVHELFCSETQPTQGVTLRQERSDYRCKLC